jgi:hypothetical protein
MSNERRWKVLFQREGQVRVDSVVVSDNELVSKIHGCDTIVSIRMVHDDVPEVRPTPAAPNITNRELIKCIPTVQLGKEKPVTMVWMQQREALIAMKAAIELYKKKVSEQHGI